MFFLFCLAQLVGRTVNGLSSGSNTVLAVIIVEYLIIFVILGSVFLVIIETLFKRRYEEEFKSIITSIQTLNRESEAKFHEFYAISPSDAAKELKLEGALEVSTIDAYFVDIPDSNSAGTSNIVENQ